MSININVPGGSSGGSYDMIYEEEIVFTATSTTQHQLTYTPSRDCYVFIGASWYGATDVFEAQLSGSLQTGTNRIVFGTKFCAQKGGNSRTMIRSHSIGPYLLKKGQTYLLSFTAFENPSGLTIRNAILSILK